MKGKLIKRGENHYDLYTEKELYTSTYQWTRQGNLLSDKNCQAIENGYDLEKLTQPKEWEVEIVTKPFTEVHSGFELIPKREPKLDRDGCLILKRK